MKLGLVVAVAALLLAPAAPAAPPSVQARAYLVENGATGEVLLGSNVRERVPIASITKLMTVLVTLEHARLDEVVTVGPEAAAVGESTIGLGPGDLLTVRELVEAALIQSANDAAVALAEHVGHGDVAAFVALMNERARELGLTDTHFVRPDGLDAPGHLSSARDVTRLARVVMRYAVVREIVAERTATIAGGRPLHTWNDLLYTFPGLIGIKTGHTAAAGWSEVAAARGRYATVYVVLLGGPSRSRRNLDLAALLRWGLSLYRPVRAVSADVVYAQVQTGYGRAPVPLVAPRGIVRVVRIDRPLVERLVAPKAVALPVERGAQLGELRVYAGRHLIARSPLVAARSVSRPDLGGRIGWYAGQTIHHVWRWISSR